MFRVQTEAEPQDSAMIWQTVQAKVLQQRENSQKENRVAFREGELPQLLRQTGWHLHVAGFMSPALVSLVTIRGGQETWVKDLRGHVESYFAEMLKEKEELGIWELQWINTDDPLSK